MLNGWVVAVKEIVDIAGVETTANTRVELPERVRWPQRDAPVVARLREAGATIGPKTTTHEFAWGITTAQPDRAQAVNPVAPGRVTGGSSGGSAAMVAGGQARLAIGTDTGGSVRIPAAWCAVVGWKPSLGLVPTGGVLPLAPSLDHVGFFARDVDTLIQVASLFGVGRGHAPDRGRRFVVGRNDAPMDRAAAAALDDAAARLGHIGSAVGDAALPSADMIVSTYRTIQLREALGVHRHLLGTWPAQRDRYSADVAPRMELAESVTDAEEVQARIDRESMRSAVLGHYARADVIVTVTTGCAPPLVERPDVADIDGTEWALRDAVLPHTVIANLTGFPAVCVPIGEGTPADGMRSVQLMGPPGSDGLLLALAAALTGG